MIFFDKPRTLARIGKFDGFFGESVRRFREPIVRVLFDLGETLNYASFRKGKNPYFLMASQNIGGGAFSLGHNVVLTVTSYSDEWNERVADGFDSDTGISLSKCHPEDLRDYCNHMQACFKMLEKNPNMAREILKTYSFARDSNLVI